MIILLTILTIVPVILADKTAQIETINNQLADDGFYSFQYETSNGILVQEAGVGSVSSQGSAQWYAPDGTPIQFSYTAGVDGYKPIGSHIPKPPPVPEYILRAQKYMEEHPWVEPKII